MSNEPYWDLILEHEGISVRDWDIPPLIVNGFWKAWREKEPTEVAKIECCKLFVRLLSVAWPKIYQEILTMLEGMDPEGLELVYSYNEHRAGEGYWRPADGGSKGGMTADGLCMKSDSIICIPLEIFTNRM